MSGPVNVRPGVSASPQSAEILISCACGKQMRAPSSAMGKTGKCSLCGRTFTASPQNSVPAPPREKPPAPVTKDGALAPKPVVRIESMDQLRGYAIMGMFLVNFLGNFAPMEWLFEHRRDNFSYADTIAPLFMFVVGMGFRLSLKRRAEKSGIWTARGHSLKRYLVLLLVAVAFYGPDYQKDWWDALTEIALAGLLTLFFIDKPLPVRLAAAFAFLGAFMYFFLGTGYGAWLNASSMNGGPLGAMSGCMALLCGTIAYDLLETEDTGKIVTWSLALGVGLIVIAFITWALIPKDFDGYAKLGEYWPFAKRWGAAPFVCLATGIAFLTFLGFYYLVDVKEVHIPHLSLFGENPLIIYLVQYSILEMNGTFLPEKYTEMTGIQGVFVALASFAVFYAFMYGVAWRLNKDRIVFRL